VHQLLKRRGLIGNERSHDELLHDDEWWFTDLARELKVSHGKLRDWARRRWIHSPQTPIRGYGASTGQIPEPTIVVLCMFGLISAVMFVRRKRRTV